MQRMRPPKLHYLVQLTVIPQPPASQVSGPSRLACRPAGSTYKVTGVDNVTQVHVQGKRQAPSTSQHTV